MIVLDPAQRHGQTVFGLKTRDDRKIACIRSAPPKVNLLKKKSFLKKRRPANNFRGNLSEQ